MKKLKTRTSSVEIRIGTRYLCIRTGISCDSLSDEQSNFLYSKVERLLRKAIQGRFQHPDEGWNMFNFQVNDGAVDVEINLHEEDGRLREFINDKLHEAFDQLRQSAEAWREKHPVI